MGWRLKMALGDTPAQEMADVLGYSRQQLSRWMSDKGATPRNGVLNQWALVTGVSAEWLKTGKTPTEPAPDGGQRPWAPRGSNPQPTD